MMISRCLRYCMAALVMSFGGMAFADVGVGASTKYFGYQVASAFESGGAYGHALACYKAEQAYMARTSDTDVATAGGLLKDKHGFMQVSADEVAKGTTGSTVSLSIG